MKHMVVWLPLILLCVYTDARADKKVVTAEHTVELGENDTKNDARRFCFVQAKRKLLESVHFHLQKSAYGDDYWFDQEDINVYADILLKIETKSDVWRWEEDKLLVTLSVETAVDTDYIGKRLQEISEDRELKEKIKLDRLQLKKQEEEYESIYRKLSAANEDKALTLRVQLQAVSGRIDELEKIKYLINTQTKIAAEKVETGMTMDEVISVAGQPRATATCEYPDFLNYGNTWIVLRNGIVVGKVPMDQWSGACHTYGQNSATNSPSQRGEDDKKAKAVREAEENKYELTLKGGKKILTPTYERIDDVIYYKRYDGIIGVEASKVDKIKELE